MSFDEDSRESRLHEVLGRYYDANGSGTEPDRAAWFSENPDLADELAEFFADQDRLAGLVSRPQPPNQDFGDYEIVREIARGGMGVVFEARQKSLHRTVALKMILSGTFASEDDLRRFQIEAEAAARLDHANIVMIHEVGRHEGRPYFSMKLMSGGTLADQIGNFGSNPRRAAQLIATIAQAVHHAHQRGVLHRDLKPSNILLDDEGRPHVADFGLARKIDGEGTVTQTGALIGSPSYMAPEQTLGKNGSISTAVDVYGLGALMYATLTGKPPFRGDSALETLELVREGTPEAPSKINPKIDRDLETICLTCLEKDTSRRYASASELANDLGRWLEGEPIAARPIGRWQQVWRWCNRNPAVAALSAAVFVVAVLGLSGVVWQWRLALRNANAVIKANDGLKIALKTARFNAYVATIHLADREWEDSNVNHARDLLDDPTTVEFRSFEWHYLNRKFHPELATLKGHTQMVNGVSFSPDGRLIASASADKSVKLWDVQSGKELLTLKGHSDHVDSVSFSPDGRLIASASADKSVKLWDVQSGKELLTLNGHSKNVGSVSFSPDGGRIATASGDGTVKVWDAHSGKELLTFKGHTDVVSGVSFSSDGRYVASGGRDKTVRVWDADSGRETLTLKGHTNRVWAVAFSPNGRLIASSAYDKTVRVWDARSGNEQLTLNGSNGFDRIAFSPDSRALAVGGRNILVYDLDAGQPKLRIRGATRGVSFSPDGRRLVSGGGIDDLDVKVWDANVSPEILTLKGHADFVRDVAFSPDGRDIATASKDQTVRIWDGRSGREKRVFKGHPKEVTAVAYSPDNRGIASADTQGIVKLWDANTGGERFVLKGLNTTVNVLVYSPDARLLAAGGINQTIKVWETRSGREVLSLKGHASIVYGLAFSPDGRRIASASNDGTIRTWDSRTGAMLGVFQDPDIPLSAAFSPDGRRIVSGSRKNRNVKVWDAETGRILSTLSAGSGSFASAIYSPDGRRIAATSASGGVRIWDAETGLEMITIKNNMELITRMAFSPVGHRIAVVGWDSAVTVWGP